MNLYGGYNGKRVTEKNKKGFKLFKQRGGKRLVKPIIFVYLEQAIEFVSGKISYISEKLKELVKYRDDEEMDTEYLKLPSYDEVRVGQNAIMPFSTGNSKIVAIDACSIDDISDIVYYVETGYITFVSYGILGLEERQEFDTTLSKELMRLGTHLTHITNTEILCSGKEASVDNNMEPTVDAKVYELQEAVRR